jgi:hypothetical protein
VTAWHQDGPSIGATSCATEHQATHWWLPAWWVGRFGEPPLRPPHGANSIERCGVIPTTSDVGSRGQAEVRVDDRISWPYSARTLDA